ncbi:MAG: osmoprotectant transport system substrate-binding protein opuBD, partial [Verrucomicrobiota bacterium]
MKISLRVTLVGTPRCGVRGHRSAMSLPILLIFATMLSVNAKPVVVGSKKFTESYVLGEIAKRSLSDAGISAEHRQGMGGTIIL